jgi:hypothetical protein
MKKKKAWMNHKARKQTFEDARFKNLDDVVDPFGTNEFLTA